MAHLRTTAARAAGTLLLSAALFGCDSTHPIAAPDSLDEARVTRAEKLAGLQSGSEIGTMAGRLPSVSPMSYTVEQIPYAPEPGTPANQGPACDDCVVNDVPIGFDFPFYGQFYSSLQISSNGFIRFAPPNNDSGCCSGRPIPLNDTWNNIIAFAWTDLNPGPAGAGQMRYETRGTEPNRRFVLHVDGVTIWPNTDPRVTQWVVLYEGTGVIEIHTAFLTPGTQNVTQGIENQPGTEAHYVAGRNAQVFSLTNDGVRFTPEQDPPIPVTIHDAYSGDPPQPSGSVSLDDEWVYVEILDPLQYRPMRRGAIPFQSADDVRIGASWETGVPAESFALVNIGGDPAEPDFRGRWDLDALRNAGLLPIGPTTLTVWGRDPVTDQLYRGEVQVTVQLPGMTLYENCTGAPDGLVTHPNGGTGPIAGQHVSMASPGLLNIAGLNHRHFPPGVHFRVADDFTVPAGGWTVNALVTHGYETGAATPTWTGFSMNIWDGVPGALGSNIVATSTSASISFSGIYRTFNGVLNNADRPVHRIVWSFGTLQLDPGTYWADWQVQGGVSGWAPMCMLPDPTGGNNTITVTGNARQLTPDGWIPTLSDVPAPPAEFPFVVIGDAGGARLPVWAPGDYGTPVTPPQAGRPAPDARAADTPQ